MSRAVTAGSVAVVILIAGALVFVWRAQVDSSRATLLVTVAMCGMTTVYALLTLGILLENRAMARAATDSTRLMERSLRFSYAPNLLFRTLDTKDPTLQARQGFTPLDTEDYRRALADYTPGQQQTEFVFAVVQNVGRGSATNLTIDAHYNIWDSSSRANRNYSVDKQASIQLLESGKAVALFVHVSRVPTGDDRVDLVSANLTTSDFYRDALDEPAVVVPIDPEKHRTESEPGCVVQIA